MCAYLKMCVCVYTHVYICVCVCVCVCEREFIYIKNDLVLHSAHEEGL